MKDLTVVSADNKQCCEVCGDHPGNHIERLSHNDRLPTKHRWNRFRFDRSVDFRLAADGDKFYIKRVDALRSAGIDETWNGKMICEACREKAAKALKSVMVSSRV